MPSDEEPAEFDLSGLTFLIPRPQKAGKSCRLANLVESSGGKPVNSPVIRLESATNSAEVQSYIEKGVRNQWTWVFVSDSSVEFLVELAPQNLLPALRSVETVAIGRSTAAALAAHRFGGEPRIPDQPNSESLADLLIAQFRDNQDSPSLVCRAEQGSPVISDRLARAQVPFIEWKIYRSVGNPELDPGIAEQLRAKNFDWILITSSMIATHAARLFADSLRELKIASLSSAISEQLSRLGLTPTVTAEVSNFRGLLSAIDRYENGMS